MLLTTETTAWTVALSAGLTTGVLLGHGVTTWTLGAAALIATIAVGVCAKLMPPPGDRTRPRVA